MGKLHELLAVETNLRQEANAAVKAVVDLFKAGTGLLGQIRVFRPLEENLEELPAEGQPLSATVDGVLEELQNYFSRYVDATVEKEVANTGTNATVVVNGIEFLNDLPATALLNLESRLEELERAFNAIPTLDPSEQWEYDADKGYHVSAVRTQFRTKKSPKAFVQYAATKEHPAQVTVFNEDINTYRIESTLFSGSLTPAEKRERLDRLTTLQRAVKKARIRANDTESTPVKIADAIFDYINTGEL